MHIRGAILGTMTWFCAAAGAVGTVAANAGTTAWLPILPQGALGEMTDAAPQAPQVIVEHADTTGIDVLVRLSGLGFLSRPTSAGAFISAGWPNAAMAGDVGTPGVPVVRRLFLVPDGAMATVTYSSNTATQIGLEEFGPSGIIEPVQPPVDMEPATAEHAPLRYERSAYAVDALTPDERVSIVEAGAVRDQRLWLLEVRPVAYNPARGALTVWPEIRVNIRWTGSAEACGDMSPLSFPSDVWLNPPPAQRAGRGHNFLIVAASEFAASAPLAQFVAAKTAQAYTVSTYTVAPGTTKETIKAYIQSLWKTTNQPNYVLLVGDTNTIPHWFGGGAKTAGTDMPYVCMNGATDWYPDAPIGRFSVRTVTELQNLVDKTLYIENGVFSDPSFLKRAVFLAGTDSLSGDEDTHGWVIDTYMRTNEIESTKLYMRSGGIDTQSVHNAFNAGCLIAAYYGHAWSNCWQNGPYFAATDVESLAAGPVCPLLLQMTCSMGTYWYEDSGCFAEVWQRVPNKGAATTVAASTTIYTDPTPWAEVADLEKFTFDAIYRDGIRQVGPAWQAALAALLAKYGPTHGPTRDYFEMFNLFGDPSLALPEPAASNYLIVTASTYAGSTPLNAFIAAKQAQGYNVMTYTVPAGTTRDAIKTYIKSLWGTASAPNCLLIVGDTSGTTATTTTIPHWVGLGSKAATTDLPYTCMDPNDDWYPEFPVGRFSVTSVAQLQAIVNKTLFVEAGSFSNPDYVRRVAFLANPDTYNTAEPTDEWVIANYLEPRDYVPIRIYAAQGGDTADVTSAVNTGCVMVTYMGHSGSGGWWDPAFDQSNVRALTNNGLYPLVFGWSCNSAHFDYDECFGETWQREVNKGAAAYLSASNYIYWGSAEAWLPSGLLEKAFFASFFERNIWRVGPAWQSALYQFLDEYGLPATPGGPPTQNADVIRNFFEEFVLLGDPALLIPQPNGFRLTATPASQTVCAPPSVSITYSIAVEKLGSFAEPITLSASGQPAGTTVSFSTNSVAPPFSSTMTISNLSAATPGMYSLTITGTAASKQSTTQAQLHVANQLPSAPTLLSPANGAVGVARMPVLTWQAAAQASQYTVEVSTNSNFTGIVYQATVTAATATVDINLDSARTYYWHALAGNGCGNGPLSETFSFTTISQRDYFTQSFQSGGGFDLANRTLYFVPDGSGNYYHACSATASSLPTDPNGGTTLSLSDDGSQSVSIGTSRVTLFGVQYGSFWIGANGHLTFNSADTTWQFTLESHFNQPRISPLMDDLTPPTGAVSWKQLADRVAVTWKNMQEWQAGGSSTFQVELFYNGEIHITWLGITSSNPIVGLSPGGGVPTDYTASDLSAYGACAPPGACCNGTTCTLLYEAECLAASGVFQGAGTSCTPNPCIAYDSTCIIISEVVQGAESGSCPRWVELTNTGSAEFAFLAGGLIVQTADSNDVTVDVDLTGLVIPAGESVVINSNVSGACTGAFQSIYSQTPDFMTNVAFGFGNERLILTDTADGSHLIDIYGEFGVNGTGQPWEFTSGYAYRLPPWAFGEGGTFVPWEWYFGGVGSLTGGDPTALLLSLTTPGTHTLSGACTGLRGDMDCDGEITYADINPFVVALTGQSAYEAMYPGCYWINADCSRDAQVTYADINPFVVLLAGP